MSGATSWEETFLDVLLFLRLPVTFSLDPPTPPPSFLPSPKGHRLTIRIVLFASYEHFKYLFSPNYQRTITKTNANRERAYFRKWFYHRETSRSIQRRNKAFVKAHTHTGTKHFHEDTFDSSFGERYIASSRFFEIPKNLSVFPGARAADRRYA